MKYYLEVAVSCVPGRQEELIPSLVELGCRGFEQSETHMEDPEGRERLEAAIRNVLLSISSNLACSFRAVPERNWNEEWERSVRPVEAGDRFIVTPSWHLPLPPTEKTVIVIDPKMSFGTGYHETTRLMLRLVGTHIRRGMNVLDVGTGSGVLAIAAALRGASAVAATDIDEWSLRNAAENVRRNGVEGIVRVSEGSVPGTGGPFDLVCANITLGEIVGLLPALRGASAPEGTLLLSGFLSSDEPALDAALAASGLTRTDAVRENEWIALAAGAADRTA
jgi:ribosomal protein L11 methyltransferase